MLSSADWTAMTADLAAVRGDNPVAITLRRGSTTLTAQTVRIARSGGGGLVREGPQTQESRGRVIVSGPTTFNVAIGDRFNDAAGVLYRVVLIRPNRRASVVAEAELVE